MVDEYIPLGKEAEKVAGALREIGKACDIIKKEIHDTEIEVGTKRILKPEEFSPDELRDLVSLYRQYINVCCKCIGD